MYVPLRANLANGQVPHLAIGWQVAQEDEVAEPALKWLRVQLRVEDAHIEKRADASTLGTMTSK